MEPPPGGPPPGELPSGPTNAADESQDSGLGLEWVYLNADVGGAYVNLQSFSESQLAIVRSETGGPTFGFGAGVRLLFLSVGVRATDLQLSAFNLWQISAEAALHMRVWRIDPYFGLRGGYAFVGGLSSDSVQTIQGQSSSAVDVHGFDVGPIAGIDFYFSHLFSIGIDANVQALFIQRPPANLPSLPPGTPANSPQAMAYNMAKMSPLYAESGSSVGLGVPVTAHLGFHF
jgi:hypothetical protein